MLDASAKAATITESVADPDALVLARFLGPVMNETAN
jgi:hypothetical protein